METNVMPVSITAMKAVTYDVQQVAEALMAENEIEANEVTLEMVMERIEEWASSDLTESRDDLIIYQDQDGGEIEL
jgi:hypothetical protein